MFTVIKTNLKKDHIDWEKTSKWPKSMVKVRLWEENDENPGSAENRGLKKGFIEV